LYASETISKGTTVSIREEGKLYYNNTHIHTHTHVRTPHNRNCNITIYLHYNAHNRVIYLMTCVAVYDI